MDKTPHPYFSIVTVTLNNLEGLKKTYKSLLAQNTDSFEWIIVDGESADGTQAWIRSLDLIGKRLQLISEPDNGLYDAMNKGLNNSRGTYILFLNAGDTLFESKILKKLENAAKSNHKPDFIFGDCHEEMTDGSSFYKPAKPISAIKGGMITHHQAMLYKRTRTEGLGFDLNYDLAADYDFTLKFLERTSRSLHCALPICTFEAGGVSQTHAKKARKEEFQIRKRHHVCGAAHNYLNYGRQSLALFIRRHMPRLYSKLRHQGA